MINQSRRTLERKFIRSVQKKGYFFTASGSINLVERVGKERIVISSSKRKEKIMITRNQLKRAIDYLQVKRTVVRKDMERFSPFSTALFGMLIQVFKKHSILQSLKNGLYRLTLMGIRFFAGGLERDPSIRKLLKNMGGRYVLFNYYQLQQSTQNWISILENEDLYALIDSGSFSYMQEKNKQGKQRYRQQELFDEAFHIEQYIEGYAAFINKYKDHPRVIGFFPFDCIGDPKQTKVNEEKLMKLTNAKIFPVWQFTDSLDELEKIVDREPDMIAIGGMVPYLSNRIGKVRDILNNVFSHFPTINFHMLGVANELLVEYPCFSSDGTAFLNARKSKRQRKIYLEDGRRIDAPVGMNTLEIIKQNLKFLIDLENKRYPGQLAMDI